LNRKQQKEYTKRQIFDTSISLFIENGYENVSIDGIVKKIGLTKGAFYHHFLSKDAIMLEYCNKALDSFTDNLLQTIQFYKEKNITDIFEYLFENISRFLIENYGMINVIITQSKKANIALEELFLNETARIFSNLLTMGLTKKEFDLSLSHESLGKYISTLLFFKIKEIVLEKKKQEDTSKEIRDIYKLLVHGIFFKTT